MAMTRSGEDNRTLMHRDPIGNGHQRKAPVENQSDGETE